MYFLLVPGSGRTAIARPILAGFFAIAALVTQPYSAFYLCALLLLYVVVGFSRPLRRYALAVLRDAALWICGGALVIIGCALVSHAYGGQYRFYQPELNELFSVDPTVYKNRSYNWFGEPRILVAPLVLLPQLGGPELNKARPD